jgi:membrane associated rhomboid family serine protease
MIPLRDNIPSRRAPVVTCTLIAINACVYFLVQPSPGTPAGLRFTFQWGLVPADLLGGVPRLAHPVPVTWTVVTSMFLHGGLFHILGNMWYLWLFGDNVEDAMGRARFLVFYLLSGVAAAAAQVLVSPASRIPMVGASGAISGVLGGYVLLYPHARILTLVPIFFFLQLLEIPAAIMLGLWFLVQVTSGLGGLGLETGGVAWFAHIGGFLAGVGMVHLFRKRQRARVRGPWDRGC